MMPWQWLEEHLLEKIICIDGIIYCAACGKMVAAQMQDDSILAHLGRPANEAKAYYRDIQRKIEWHESMERMREAAVDEEINWDDAAKMKKLLRNRDGSMETKSLKEKLQNVIKKDIQKMDEKKIMLGGANVGI
jgi:hypothetical protein